MNAPDPRNVVILGSTGSIGRSTLDVIAALPERFRVLALAAGQNAALLARQVAAFHPRYASCQQLETLPDGTTRIDDDDALTTLATLPDADIIVVATTGHAAIEPTIRALEAGKIVALANKETIVAAGEIVMPIARSHPGALRPVDSEHSALWQCIGSDRVGAQVRRLVLTASGGPFRGWSSEQLLTVTPAMALQHPTWSMGAKITIDSATLMNKGLELIEAHWLFDCPFDALDVIVHPQSLVHSLVEFVDGSFLAQIGSHDMRLPIQYALTWPDRAPGPAARLSLSDLSRLDFTPPDPETFPLLRLAREAGQRGGTWPTVLSAADSVGVDAFLAGRISFPGIAALVEATLAAHDAPAGPLTLAAIRQADAWAEHTAQELVNALES